MSVILDVWDKTGTGPFDPVDMGYILIIIIDVRLRGPNIRSQRISAKASARL